MAARSNCSKDVLLKSGCDLKLIVRVTVIFQQGDPNRSQQREQRQGLIPDSTFSADSCFKIEPGYCDLVASKDAEYKPAIQQPHAFRNLSTRTQVHVKLGDVAS